MSPPPKVQLAINTTHAVIMHAIDVVLDGMGSSLQNILDPPVPGLILHPTNRQRVWGLEERSLTAAINRMHATQAH